MLIDFHAHTSGISKCCRIAAPDVLSYAKSVGLDGIVLTNHYQKSYLENVPAEHFVEKYIEEYYYTKKCGEKVGCKVFFGIEVTMEQYENVHFLIYGVEKSFLRNYPFIFDYSQEELYNLVKKFDGVLVQAHPFRNGTHVLDVRFLDGLEINCHPLYGKTYQDELKAIAKQSGLMLTCGGDFHQDTYRPHCGTYLPDQITSSKEIGAFIQSADQIKLLVQEPHSPIYEELLFQRERASR